MLKQEYEMLVNLRAVGRWVAAFNNQATLFASVRGGW